MDIIKKNKELEITFDLDLIEDTSNRIHMKKIAIQTCINLIAKTISLSEFRVRRGEKYVKDEMYYRLNVQPNLNQSAATFWEQVIYKLIYDNECLIIQTDTQDLLIADSFSKVEYAVYEDVFKSVVVKNNEFKRTFKRDDVIYLEYNNERLMPIIDGLYADYGELFGRIIDAQKRKDQIRGTVNIDELSAKDDKRIEKASTFINKMYKAFSTKDIAIVPQQKGFQYEEHSKSTTKSQSVDEVTKTIDGFLTVVARALNIPPALVKGEIADVENQTRNFMTFCVDPLLNKIKDELNSKSFSKNEILQGDGIDIRRVSYRDIFDIASAADKLRAAGIYSGNELRDKLGDDQVDDPILDRYYITKNYTADSLEGGESE